jgi:hypothetical protein
MAVENLLVEYRALCVLDSSDEPANLSLADITRLDLRRLMNGSFAPSWPQRGAYQGRWFYSRSGAHAHFESLAERSLLTLLDYEGLYMAVVTGSLTILTPRGLSPLPREPWALGRTASGEIDLIFKPARITDAERAFSERSKQAGLGVRFLEQPPDGLKALAETAAAYRQHRWSPDANVREWIRHHLATPTPLGDVVAQLQACFGGPQGRYFGHLLHLHWWKSLVVCGQPAVVGRETLVSRASA